MEEEPKILKTFAVTMLQHDNFTEHWVQIDVFETHTTMYRGTNTHADINSDNLVAEETQVDSDCTDEQLLKTATEALLDMIDV